MGLTEPFSPVRRGDFLMLQCRALQPEVAALYFTTRHGPQLSSPNLRLSGQDPWEELLEALGLPGSRLRRCRQVHGSVVWEADRLLPGQLPPGDGLVTAGPQVLGAQFADCLAIWVLDTAAPALGLLHAGWRGLRAGIVAAGLKALDRVGSGDRGRVRAVLGPCIGPCCYEVGEEVAAWFHHRFPGAVIRRGHRRYLDLREVARQQLAAEGVKGERVVSSQLCTCCRSDLFHSHRRDGGRAGRMAAIGWLREGRNRIPDRRSGDKTLAGPGPEGAQPDGEKTAF